MAVADQNTFTSLMPKGVMERLGKFGYAVNDTQPNSSSAPIERILVRLCSLPGVSCDPVTKAAIELVLRMELNPNEDPFDIPEGTPRQEASDNRGTIVARQVEDVPGV